MNKKIDLQHKGPADVHEIKKNIPNREMFLEVAANIVALCSDDEHLSVFRFDISHFKQVIDDYGFEVGENVIVACYQMIESNFKNSTDIRNIIEDSIEVIDRARINGPNSFTIETVACLLQFDQF